MKIVVYGPEKRVGVLHNGSVADANFALAKYLGEVNNERNSLDHATAIASPDLGRFIEGGKRALDNTRKAIDYLFGKARDHNGPRGETVVYEAGKVKLHAPRPRGARIACAGGNFADHAEAMAKRMHKAFTKEARQEIRDSGIWGFWKVHREPTPPDGEVTYPAKCQRLDYEGEAAIVLGKQGTDIRAGELKDYVWGVTLLGDWSIRQMREGSFPHNFAMGKNFDGSCSLGPCIAVGELDATNVQVETWVNGDRRQNFNTKDMVFSFGEFLEYLSRDFTLYPGDMISGGTAAGTAADSSEIKDGVFAPERFLKAGDNVEIKSPAIGSLRARIVAKRNR
jgi:acylpyruvate hydrolase